MADVDGRDEPGHDASIVRAEVQLLAGAVEGEVDGQDVDAGFADEAKQAAFGVGGDDLLDLGLGDAAGLGDAGDLEGGEGRGDVGVEAGCGGCDGVAGGRVRAELADVFGDAVDEGLGGGARRWRRRSWRRCRGRRRSSCCRPGRASVVAEGRPWRYLSVASSSGRSGRSRRPCRRARSWSRRPGSGMTAPAKPTKPSGKASPVNEGEECDRGRSRGEDGSWTITRLRWRTG